MSSIDLVTLTPPRKRAASGTRLRSYHFPATPENLPEVPSTPDVHSVPELVRDDSPEVPESSPRTPSDEGGSSQALPTQREIPATPTRPLKGLRRSNRIKAREASKRNEQGSVEHSLPEPEPINHKPSLLFPLFLYPDLPKVKNEDSRAFNLVNGDIGQRNFKFSEISKKQHRYNTRSSAVPATPAREPPYTPAKQRVSEPKRVKQETTPSSQIPNYSPDMAANVEAVWANPVDGPAISSITAKFESSPETGSIQYDSKARADRWKVRDSSKANEHFLRILPFNALERLIEEPNICIASLVRQPDKRCRRRIRPCKDTKIWLRNNIPRFGPSKDLLAAESYLRELIAKSTCTAGRPSHRSIATEQLERLLDWFNESHNRDDLATKSKHDFTNRDREGIQGWLEAVTTFPDSHRSENEHLMQQTPTSSEDSVSIVSAAAAARPSSTSTSAQTIQSTESSREPHREFWDVKAVKRVTSTGDVETTETTHTSYDSADTLQSCETTKVIQVTQILDPPHPDQTSSLESRGPQTAQTASTEFKEQIEQTVLSDQTVKTEATSSHAGLPQPSGEVETSKKTDTAPVSAGALDANTKIVMTYTIAQYSVFDPTQTVDIQFFKPPTIRLIEKRESDERTKAAAASQEIDIQALYQRFKSYRPTDSRGLSTPEWIRRCLVSPLSLQEYNMTYHEKREQKQHMGIIYMYWLTGSFGFVKIGKTSGKSTKERLKKWERSCGYAVEEHTRGEEETAVQLPHVYRVERLVHAELVESRLTELACPKCSKRKTRQKRKKDPGCPWAFMDHQEWFRVSPDHAERVIRKWSDWILTEPYEEVAGGQWRLKKTVTPDKIKSLCTPLEISLKGTTPLPTRRRHVQTETKGRRRSK